MFTSPLTALNVSNRYRFILETGHSQRQNDQNNQTQKYRHVQSRQLYPYSQNIYTFHNFIQFTKIKILIAHQTQ